MKKLIKIMNIESVRRYGKVRKETQREERR